MCRKGELSPAHSTFNYRNQARQTIIAGHLQPFPDVAYPFNKQLALSCGAWPRGARACLRGCKHATTAQRRHGGTPHGKQGRAGDGPGVQHGH